MMRLVQFVSFLSLMATATAAEEGTSLDALQKRFPNSDLRAVKAAAAWLEDNFGAATAEDLNGVSNFAVDAMSLASSDSSLNAKTKRILQRLFSHEVDAKTDARPKTSLEVLQQTFPDSVSGNVLQTVAKWLEENFGASTAEDMDGVSDWAVNAMTLVKGDGRLGAEEKRTLQLFFQISHERRMNNHAMASSSMMSSPTTTSSSSTSTTTTTTTTTTTMMATTTTTMKKDDGGDSKKATTTTTTMAAVATTTTTMKAAVATTTTMAPAGTTFTGQITLEVSDVNALLNDLPKAKLVLKDAIAHANPEIPSADHVTINSITKVGASGGRRLSAGGVLVDWTVTLPASYSGAGITSASFDTTKLKDKVTNNAHGVTVTVTKATISKAPTCAAGGAACPKTTTVKMTTTEGTEVTGGAVTAQQLATSVAAMLLVKLLSGL